MKRLLIIHHSMTDGTRQMGQAALEGAMGESNIAVAGMHAAETSAEDLLESDGYIFATPENLASMAGVMKDFFDRCYYPLLDQIQGRPYATQTPEAIAAPKTISTADLARCHELGAAFAAGLTAGIF
ncbi:MAG: flavodoxin family protein [Acetobacteraceae bacterium]|nr:flavodoxin family protein [Acetobacteraceae bacterium]